MKRLPAYLIIFFCFSLVTNVKAESISDFQIEGMSIGDSLIKYFSKKDIQTKKKYRIKYPKSNKFSAITFQEYPNLKVYDSIQINVKTKDKKYSIYSLSGIIYFADKIDKCREQMQIISDDLIKIFPSATNQNQKIKHTYDKSGESLIYQSRFDMFSGAEARVECYDWSNKMLKKHNLEDQLVVSIFSEEFSYFLSNEAY